MSARPEGMVPQNGGGNDAGAPHAPGPKRSGGGGGKRRRISREEMIARHVALVRPRYRKATKTGKGAILDGLGADTGRHRKSLIRALARESAPPAPRSGRPPRYGPEVAEALLDLWHVLQRPDDARLAAGAADAARALNRSGRRACPDEVVRQLDGISASAVRRLLRPLRARDARWRPSPRARKANRAARERTPVRTHRDWADACLGSMQADTVHHSGPATAGKYVCSLVAVETNTSWVELEALPQLSQRHAVSAFDRIRRRLPFRLAALHTDNGAEFQNAGLDGWCVRNGVARTRGRPRRSNDQAYAEQRNWTAVRRLTGDARLEGEAAREALAGLYAALRDYMNFFQPVRKVTGTERQGAKVVRRYDRGRTPYRRLLDEDDPDAEAKRRLTERFLRADPEELQERIDAALDRLERLGK